MTEGAFEPDWFSRPGETVSSLMSRRGLSAMDLAERLGCGREKVRGLLTGLTAIDDDLANGLAEAVGGTPAFWRKRQATYERCLARAADSVPAETASHWLMQIPLSGMASSGWIERPPGRPQALRSCLAYFGVTGPDEWRRRYAEVAADVAFRTSPTFESSLGPLSAWLRQAEIEASMMSCATWDRDALEASLGRLRKLTLLREPSKFLPRLRSICAEAGVAVVVLRAPQGCRASGATRFVSPDRAMVVLSFRHLSEDHFWFTFFHEVGHLLLHGRSATFVDVEAAATDEREREANAFAATTLIPAARQGEMATLGARSQRVLRFAASVGISPGIVVGQMQHQALLGPANLNFLKRRYAWEDIDAALA
ncbi:ImmA/IrrE family metallo-endopeptidase [Roseicella aerolata]|uniref:ImmA/IrrE family metallo-endopeptidase n=1 Tax=Roseicella aerolata TaxID=2883479 RepID=A0A9X1IKC0_9PROT|nr:ImmA/IrrE family metallo-endopeptidase [Roseicella aerolata]MCB4824645.1 ImmA/IrrE family metallo-endopeptidase [Roseicella aerolata]